MNERIKELAEKAREYADSIYVAPGSDNTWGVRFQKKFAELIVKECADRLMQDDFKDFKSVVYIAGLRLKEHFGVEE